MNFCSKYNNQLTKSHLQQIIFRYESGEEEFLRELEAMQIRIRADSDSTRFDNAKQVNSININTDTSIDDERESEVVHDELPVLGTLCTLLSEISELRRENRRLLQRLSYSTRPEPVASSDASDFSGSLRRIVPSGSSSSTVAATTFSRSLFSLSSASSEAVGRVGSYLASKARLSNSSSGNNSSMRPRGTTRNGTSLLPRLISSSGRLLNATSNTLGEGPFASPAQKARVLPTPAKYGAPEQLSSPAPQKNHLSVSAYSADLSSDALSTCQRTPQPPSLAKNEQHKPPSFYMANNRLAPPSLANGYSDSDDFDTNVARASRRSMTRRASDHAIALSSSSVSASSSADPFSDQMTVSRSSFLDLFGLRLKRKSSNNSNTNNSQLESDSMQRQNEEWPQPKCDDKPTQIFRFTGMKRSKRRISENAWNTPTFTRELQDRRRSAVFISEHADFSSSPKSNVVHARSTRRERPQSVACALGAAVVDSTPHLSLFCPQKSQLKLNSLTSKTKSCRSVYEPWHCKSTTLQALSVTNSEPEKNAALARLEDACAIQRGEIKALRARNTHLIEQLRENLARQSHSDAEVAQLRVEVA